MKTANKTKAETLVDDLEPVNMFFPEKNVSISGKSKDDCRQKYLKLYSSSHS